VNYSLRTRRNSVIQCRSFVIATVLNSRNILYLKWRQEEICVYNDVEETSRKAVKWKNEKRLKMILI